MLHGTRLGSEQSALAIKMPKEKGKARNITICQDHGIRFAAPEVGQRWATGKVVAAAKCALTRHDHE